MYIILRSKQAKKDAETCVRAGFKEQLDNIRDTLKRDPYEFSQGFERLAGNLKGFCSREINRVNRVLYEVLANAEGLRDEDGELYDGIVKIYESWGHRYKKPKNN
jgi:Txe/YoeB family toxin of toxin-antitoxin system